MLPSKIHNVVAALRDLKKLRSTWLMLLGSVVATFGDSNSAGITCHGQDM